MYPCVTSLFRTAQAFQLTEWRKIGYIQSLLEQEKAELPPEEKTEAPAALSADRHNFRITDDTLGTGRAKEKFRGNMAAINLLHELEIEKPSCHTRRTGNPISVCRLGRFVYGV